MTRYIEITHGESTAEDAARASREQEIARETERVEREQARQKRVADFDSRMPIDYVRLGRARVDVNGRVREQI